MTDPVNLSDATVAELKDRAGELGITGRSKMNAEALRNAIASAEANTIPPGTPDETGRPELLELAEQRAADRNPRRVGATTD